MIFTDPPYKRPDLYLYGDLAKLAQLALKPGGSLVTFVGHYAIFEINDLIRANSDLIYHWQIVVIHEGGKEECIRSASGLIINHSYGTTSPWREMATAPTMYEDVADVIPSKAPMKDDYEWEQSTVELCSLSMIS